MFPNSLRSFFVFFFLFALFEAHSQNSETSVRKLKKVGFLYNYGKQNNLLFSDRDYDYQTHVFKGQLFYNLRTGNKWDMNLIVQPQVHIANHQLLNRFFITPEDDDFEALREHLTQKRTLSLTALELGFQLRTRVLNSLYFETSLGAGVAYIDKETERLAKGFTFIENLSVGLSYQFKTNEIYLGTNFGHVSNFNFQEPNSGYDILGFEIGYRFYLQ